MDRIAERLQRPRDEIPVGDPWEVRIPTNLVVLQDLAEVPGITDEITGNPVNLG